MANKTFTVESKSPDGKYGRALVTSAKDAKEARRIGQDYNLAVAEQEQSQAYEVSKVTSG
jgi:hypothetical protein